MGYQVLARKWRPQQFENVLGQETVTHTLQNAIRSGRIGHAFLFSGVRGVGKTTTARILAKALNCHNGLTPSPCGKCVSCREIAEANSVDVLEIDAASNTGVESIRELRERILYGTARDRFKIFIIDEVHMLSNAAFNALLKTLEEPPSHVKFVLATTEYHRIPETITSRCQQFVFKPIAFSLSLEKLRLICGEEGLQISDYALKAIVSSAQGSMRDAQSTLDQIVAFSGQDISDEDVRILLGVVDDALVSSVMETLLACDRKALLEAVQELINHGVDPQNFCRKLIGHIRNLLVYRVAGWEERLLHLPDSEEAVLLRQSKQVSELNLLRCYDLVNRTLNELRWHSRPYIHLEMALMKLVEMAQLPTIEKVLTRLASGREQVRIKHPVQLIQRAKPETSVKPDPLVKSPGPLASSQDEVIAQLLVALQDKSMRLYSSLQSASFTEFVADKLSLRFPFSESFHYQTVVAPGNRSLLEQLCAKITGSRVEIEAKMEKPDSSASIPDPVEDPKVKAFIEAFPGKVIVEGETES